MAAPPAMNARAWPVVAGMGMPAGGRVLLPDAYVPGTHSLAVDGNAGRRTEPQRAPSLFRASACQHAFDGRGLPAFPCGGGNSNVTFRYSSPEAQNHSLVFAFTSERSPIDSNHEWSCLCMTLVSQDPSLRFLWC